MADARKKKPVEVALVGDVDDWEEDAVKALLEAPRGGAVVLYLDSPGGSVFGALAVLTLLRERELKATAVVLGECSSAALLVFAGCATRKVTHYSSFLFHRMRWQGEKNMVSNEAVHWAGHFTRLEADLDALQLRLFGVAGGPMAEWVREGRYVSGTELAELGLAELMDIG